MVTTTGETAIALFRQALEETMQVIAQVDALEEQVRKTARDVLVLAMQTVAPTVKLIDRELVASRGNQFRGIDLSMPKLGKNKLFLLRDGTVYWGYTEQFLSINDFGNSLHISFTNTEFLVKQVIGILELLAICYVNAVRKNEGRHEWLTDTLVQLTKASQGFKTKV